MYITDPVILSKCREIFRAAISAEIGVKVTTNNQAELTNTLRVVRKTMNDPRLQDLRVFAPANGEVFVCKKQVDLD